MRYILFLLCLSTYGAAPSNLPSFYWFAATIPAVALTVSNIVSVDHCSGFVNSVQIGDDHGILPLQCTAFVTDGICGGSIQNCEWKHQYNNVTNDSYFFYTCRPITGTIAYIQTNVTVGSPVVILSVLDRQWHDATIIFSTGGTIYTFPDGETAYYEVMICQGFVPSGGDSCSPVFRPNGDFVGNLTASSSVTNAIIHCMYPSGSRYRPVNTLTQSAGRGLSALFNSDPDK